MRFSPFAFVLAALVAGCGGKSAPATSTIEHSDSMHDEHAGMPADVTRFHDELAPLYHAAPGPDRVEAACGAMGDFNELIGNLEQAPPPADVDAVAWGERVGELRGSIGAFGIDCVENDRKEFDARFETLHDSFHALIELLPHHEGK